MTPLPHVQTPALKWHRPQLGGEQTPDLPKEQLVFHHPPSRNVRFYLTFFTEAANTYLLVFVLTSAAPTADRLLLRILVRASLGGALHPRPLGVPGRARWAGRMQLAGGQSFMRKDATKAEGMKTASQMDN